MDLRGTVLKLLSGELFISALEFAAVALFTQLLSPAAIGSFFLFQTLTGVIGIVADVGVSRATEKSLSAGAPAGEVISSAFLAKTALIAPWVLALWLTKSYVNQYVAVEGAALLVALGLITLQTERVSIRILAGQMQIHRTALLRVLGRLTWVGGGILLINYGFGTPAIIISFIAGNLFVIATALTLADIQFSFPTIARIQSLVDFGRYVFIGSVGGFVYSWMDVAILRFFVPPSLIGAYEIAWRVASLSMLLTKAIRQSLFPQISEWHSNGDMDAIESAFEKWLQPPLYMAIPAFFGAIVLGADILGTMFGDDVVIAYVVLLIFTLEKIVRSIHLIFSPALFAMNKPQLGYRGSVVSIVVNLVLNLILIPVFGLEGAAVATATSALVAAVVNYRYVTRFVAVNFHWSRIAWSIGCSAVMAGVVYILLQTIATGWIRIIIGVTAGTLIYGVLLLANTSIQMDLRAALQDLSSPT